MLFVIAKFLAICYNIFMSKNILDIYAVQGISEELPFALDNIKTDDAIIFENAIIELKIDEEKIMDKIFCCVIYSEESDVMIMIMKNSPVTSEDAKNYLDSKGIKYHTVTFIEDEHEYETEVTTPEIWFARDSQVVEEAVCDSKSKSLESLTFTFNPETKSRLKFHFLTSAEKNKITFDGKIRFKGMIKLEDKIVLLVDQEDITDKSIKKSVIKILKKHGFSGDLNTEATL